jgi:Big-like domain-containing protein
LILVKCATKGRPGGGPVDKTPPEIIYTFPAIDSLGVKNLDEIQVHFSERMDESSVKKSLFISPTLDYEIDWSGGDELTLEISPDSLQPNQTYVITLGSGAQDSRRNKMTSSFQFAFSTGDYLDQGKISGNIIDLKKNEVMYIYAYEYVENDTIDPRFHTARFLTQSGDNGQFQLSYLPLKNYRVFVVEDQNKNLLLDAAYERIGFPTNDVNLDSLNLEFFGLHFKLTQIDTSAPFITGARAIFNNTILLRASEELKELVHNKISIVDTLHHNNLNIIGITESKESSSQYLLYTDIQDSTAYYRMTVTDIADTNNNQQEEPSIVYFSGNNRKDTTSFELKVLLPPDSAKTFSIYADVITGFSLPVNTSSLNNGFKFIHEPNDTLTGSWNLQELKQGGYQLYNDLEPGNDYRIILQTKLINSVWGDTLQDTVFNHIFSTVSSDEFGSISGRILIDSTRLSQLYLSTVPIKRKSKSYQVIMTEKNEFKIDWLLEGFYIFKGFFDLDNDQKWSPGKMEPFQFAEPIFVKDDTIRVRKRWETDDLIIQFED